MPDMRYIMDCLARAICRSKIDMTDAYEQIRIELPYVPRTAFALPWGTYISNVLQQGDCNGPSTFQRGISWTFRKEIGLTVHVWFDDIFTGTQTVAEHNEKLMWIYERLKEEKLYISRKKFEPYAPILDILGCKVDHHGVHADADKMGKIRDWRIPNDHTEVLRFLGLVEYLARFMPDVSAYTGPLQTICANKLPFMWTPLHQKCFGAIKAMACKSPILKPIIWEIPEDFPKENRDLYKVWVVTDACPAGMGAVLSQGNNWETARPSAFMSKKFTSTQRGYFTYEHEALGVLEALTKWQDELSGGRKFTVVTDHEALTFFKEKSHMSGRHIRWQNFFHGFKCNILYVEGNKNKVADALSRYYSSSSDEELHYDDFVSADIRLDKNGDDLPLNRLEEAKEMLNFHRLSTKVKLAAARDKGKRKQEVRESRHERDEQADELDPPEEPDGGSELTLADIVKETDALRPSIEGDEFLAAIKIGYTKIESWKDLLKNPSRYEKFKVIDSLITRITDQGIPLLVIPKATYRGESVKGIIIDHLHNTLGHLGYQKTLDYIRRYYWWSEMSKDIEKYILTCEVCKTSKRRTSRKPGLLHQLPIPEAPWTSISMDFVGPFPKSIEGFNYLWVILCRLSSQVHLIPLKTTTNALELAHEFLKNIVRLHGLPSSIISDRDPKFTSKFWTELHRLLAVKLKKTTAFHPEGDGQAERMIQNVVQILRTAIRPDQRDWVIQIPMTEFAINSSRSSSTGFAPFELVYGMLPSMTLELPKATLPGVEEFAQQAINNLQTAHDAIIKSRVDQAYQANKSRQEDPLNLEVGDLAYLSTTNLNMPKGRAKKLNPLYIGPYKIIKSYPTTSNYVLLLPPELKNRGIHPKFHVSRLAPHEPNDFTLFPGRAAQVYYDFGEDPSKEFTVSEIVDHLWNETGELWFRVKWSLGDLTWEPLTTCDELAALDEYLVEQGVKTPEELSKESKISANKATKIYAEAPTRPSRLKRKPARFNLMTTPHVGRLWR